MSKLTSNKLTNAWRGAKFNNSWK